MLIFLFIFLLKFFYGFSSSFKIYFSPTTNLSNLLIEMINHSSKNIEGAFYHFNDKDAIEALKRAKQRNVKIKLVIDNSNDSTKLEGIDVIIRKEGKGIMHNKFCIFDDIYLWTGSSNITSNTHLQYNDVVIIESSQVVENYKNEFNELSNEIFGKGEATKNINIDLEDIKIKNYFSPEDNIKNKILEELSKAKKDIKFAIFYFADNIFSNILIEKFFQGVEIKGVVDSNTSEQINRQIISPLKEMHKVGIPIKQPTSLFYIMHHKFIVIDNKKVITGSFNLTNEANLYNDENILIIENEEVAKIYTSAFEKIYKEYTVSEVINVYTKPNPVQEDTTIVYILAINPTFVKINIFNLSGEKIITLFPISFSCGYNEIYWNSKNNYNRKVSNGLYFIQVEAKNFDNKIIYGYGKLVIKR